MLTATHGDSHAMLGISHVSPEKKRKCSEVGSQKGKRENTCPLSFLSQTFPEVVLNLVHTSGCNWFLCRILESQDVGPIERHELMVSLLTLQLHKSLVNFFPMCILMISVTSDLTNSAFFFWCAMQCQGKSICSGRVYVAGKVGFLPVEVSLGMKGYSCPKLPIQQNVCFWGNLKG